MITISTKQKATNVFDQLRDDIIRSSKQDQDILEMETQDHFKGQFHSHCKRVWERLEPSQRQKIREWMKRNRPEYNDDMWCAQEIGKLLKKESLPYFQNIS